jgi:hypothetical protein
VEKKELKELFDFRYQSIYIEDFVQKIKSDNYKKHIEEMKMLVWIKYFRKCQKNPQSFLLDPFLIERKLDNFVLLTDFFSQDEWPALYEIIRQIGKLEEETRYLRYNLVAVIPISKTNY